MLANNINQAAAMTRAAAAKAQGLDPNIYGVPLPGSNVTTTTNNSGMGWLGVTVLTLGSLAAGAAAVGALTSKVPSPLPAQESPLTKPKAYIGIYEQQQPDGTWKELKREPLK
jgi:hypothetical protein